mmetsp:Transcript_81740/g.249690  ORF Transcript_81740/g.249690 Transcript_81740/m.249690 type:complete len:344 (+) Transcript_81740:896-1927(+)
MTGHVLVIGEGRRRQKIVAIALGAILGSVDCAILVWNRAPYQALANPAVADVRPALVAATHLTCPYASITPAGHTPSHTKARVARVADVCAVDVAFDLGVAGSGFAPVACAFVRDTRHERLPYTLVECGADVYVVASVATLTRFSTLNSTQLAFSWNAVRAITLLPHALVVLRLVVSGGTRFADVAAESAVGPRHGRAVLARAASCDALLRVQPEPQVATSASDASMSDARLASFRLAVRAVAPLRAARLGLLMVQPAGVHGTRCTHLCAVFGAKFSHCAMTIPASTRIQAAPFRLVQMEARVALAAHIGTVAGASGALRLLAIGASAGRGLTNAILVQVEAR